MDQRLPVDSAADDKKGEYALIRDVEEETEMGMFDKPLPCFGCGIGWFSFLLGFVFPLMWYFATILYFGNYYRKDPRERAGLAASAIAICNLSPMIPIPPPPPPPFTMEAWRFRRQGDFVRINSDTSSRSASPELEDAEDSPTATAADGGDAALFCPSPDVDTKAHTFIARFRAGLNLEKMNSIRRSNLGPGPSFQ